MTFNLAFWESYIPTKIKVRLPPHPNPAPMKNEGVDKRVRLPPDMQRRVEQEAARTGKTHGQVIVDRIERSFREPDWALTLLPEIAIFAMLRAEQRVNDGINNRIDPESAVPAERSS